MDQIIAVTYAGGFMTAWVVSARWWLRENPHDSTMIAGAAGLLPALFWPFMAVGWAVGSLARATLPKPSR